MKLVAALQARASLVLLVTVGATVAGLVGLWALPSGIHPEVEFPRVVVVAHIGDLPPEVIETVATRPLEEVLSTLPDLERVRSRTIRGAVQVDVQFDPALDTWRALQLVESKVSEVRGDLPPEAEIVVERVLPTAVPILTLNVTGDPDPRVLRDVATRIVRPALTRVEGVGEVQVQGGDVREVEVVLRPAALAAAHLRPSQIADKLAASDFVRAVGRAHDAHQVLTIMATSEHTTAEAIAALPVASGPHGPVPLSSVADVFVGEEDRTLEVDSPVGDAVVIMVARSPSASAPAVAAGAKRVVERLRREHTLPAGIRVRTVYDESDLIDASIRGVFEAIALGIALSLLVLAVFLRDWRAGVTAAIAVPVTLVCSFGVMKMLGQTLNLMSVGGLAVAIGLVVDDAIVIAEAIVERLEHGADVSRAAAEGTAELFAPVLGTTLTTVVVFAPLPLVSGVVGKFFGALAVTLCTAVLLSLLVAVTLVPLAATRLLRPRGVPRVSRLARGYGRALRRMAGMRGASLLAVAALAVVLGLSVQRLAIGFLPSLDEGAFVLDFFLPAGTSLEETDQLAEGLDRVLVETPEVVSFTRRTGTEMGPATATQQNRGDILVRVAPHGERPPIFDIMDDVRGRAARAVPEARIEIIQVLQDVLDDLSGAPSPIEVKIFGPDPRALDELARQAAKRIENVPGLEDFWNGVEGDVPTLRVEIDPRMAARAGATPEELAEDLDVALAGRVATQVRIDNYSVGVRVRMPDAVRFDPNAIAALPIAVDDAVAPLSSRATVSRPLGPSVIKHENQSAVVVLTAATGPDADLSQIVGDIAQRLGGMSLPPGYRLEIGGQYQSALATQRDLAMVFGLGVLLVLAVLVLQLRFLRLSLVVLLGAPLSLAGACVTLLATGTPLNASSLMGMVLLTGLVVKNGILLLERALHERAGAPNFAEAIARAGQRRVRPILMTTTATVVGLAPLALGLGTGSELQRPLAIATIGGLLLSTLVTLFVVPALAASVMPSDAAAPQQRGGGDDEAPPGGSPHAAPDPG